MRGRGEGRGERREGRGERERGGEGRGEGRGRGEGGEGQGGEREGRGRGEGGEGDSRDLRDSRDRGEKLGRGIYHYMQQRQPPGVHGVRFRGVDVAAVLPPVMRTQLSEKILFRRRRGE